MSLVEWIDILNAGAVGFFGAILSAAFCDIKWNQRNKRIYGIALIVLAVVQASLFLIFGTKTLREWYPVITHIPLVILLGFFTHKWFWSMVAVLMAYLCCQLRRWTGLLAVEIFSGGEAMQDMMELLVTVPLLVVILRFFASSIRGVAHYPFAIQIQFGIIPVIGYVFDYLTRVYTNWLVKGVPAAVEFMPFVCAVAYLVFVMYSTEAVRKQSELEQIQDVLDLQVRQSARQIADMKKSQEQAAAYRHDLRHHLLYLSGCIENQELEQAKEYIQSLNDQIMKQSVTQYCENIAANLILSAYGEQAREMGVPIKIQMQLEKTLHVSDSDLCVLLSNALENALRSCIRLKAFGKEVGIKVQGYTKGQKLLIEIMNSCDDTITFENGIPCAKEKGHGIGVRSICAVVEKYNGIHSFEAKDGQFVLRLFL